MQNLNTIKRKSPRREKMILILAGLVSETLRHADVAHIIDINPYLDQIIALARQGYMSREEVNQWLKEQNARVKSRDGFGGTEPLRLEVKT